MPTVPQVHQASGNHGAPILVKLLALPQFRAAALTTPLVGVVSMIVRPRYMISRLSQRPCAQSHIACVGRPPQAQLMCAGKRA